MSIVQLRIELPTYAHSFSIQVPEDCTILDVKTEISRICPGRPRVDGQKLIWRGRFLADHEKIETIWKSPSEPRIMHLSVHPSAWISGPPAVQLNSNLSTHLPSRPTPTSTTSPHSPPMLAPTPPSTLTAKKLPFVFAKHVEAIAVLMEGRTNPAGVNAMPSLREDSIRILELNGWSWPSILDEPYPEVTPGGLKYERILYENAPYLTLQDESAQPTPAQAHALRVLSYTFSILTKEFPHENSPNPNHSLFQTIPDRHTVHDIPHINDLLQQMGLPPLHNAHNVEAVLNQEQPRVPNLLPDVPIRPLLAPFLMLILRTSLLLYFVAPTRKPIFGILIIAWMLYEIWQPIRNNLLRQIQQNEQAARRNEGQGPAAPAQPAMRANLPEANNLPAQGRAQPTAFMEMLGNMNVETEQEVMATATQQDPREPGLGHKIVTFFSLMVTTLHPAIWNQRRIALRSREGIIRAEANMRNTERRADLEGEEAIRNEELAEDARRTLRERHARRPQWIQQYIERVIDADWVDDAD
ncbi:hypothetical protein NP233_g1292 [Leucocoprinus birnbaumii]|uniref:Ubiquitin-like domain-containing protein n=1 Tax=Leucocoprinus birnbaumii TaxID=56174 RepID=A0AAD5W5S0_9AGAR|nr:hypothetical protein NP233_g1292 [Leucocoprinus birnbaumii]